MGRVSALSDWNMHSHNSDNDYLLLNSAASVHVFYDKNTFTNFRRAMRSQGLLCDIKIITIKG